MCSACHFVLVGMDRVTVHTVSFESETFQISNLVGQRVLSVNGLSSLPIACGNPLESRDFLLPVID